MDNGSSNVRLMGGLLVHTIELYQQKSNQFCLLRNSFI